MEGRGPCEHDQLFSLIRYLFTEGVFADGGDDDARDEGKGQSAFS